MKALAVLCVRNEAAFLIEWLAHHRAVGFTDFLVFSNDCQDGTDILLDRLQDMGEVQHIRNDGPYDKRGIQFTALKIAEKLPIVAEADWILPLDVDEFVNIKTGGHQLVDLFAALPDADAIALTWRLFGNAGKVRYDDLPVTDQFRQAAPEVLFWPWRASMFKTLYRNSGVYKKLGVHRPRSPDPDRVEDQNWFDGEGRALDAKYKTKRIFSNFGRSNTALVQLNHYPLGAMESYVLKADRGRAVHSSDLLGVDYWIERNFNQETDTSIDALKPERAAIAAGLMTDDTLAKLHAAAVNWRKARFDALMLQEPFRALFGRLLMTPPSRLVPQKAASFMMRYANTARKTAKN
ncbi:glycosyltransferase family 2 protein [Algirhabdus cladophorae]|uniref:glycosyltransferase family 2 protein n=1 Tax=Algirhabdus cladophorae TaxID=3377108 RepID=UPI003B84B108